ncbi:MAG: squalene/phytoene synthase family protein [Verrucomicrobiota bacterium]|nr:squalene/phytoene synthase family protein [Verrucomicrobiota bacterium]
MSELLRSVSRSFYLSIRVLPPSLREPVALAYLLARTTDTIADTSGIDVALREQMLDAFGGAIQGGPTDIVEKMRSEFAPRQANDAERKLIVSADVCLSKLAALAAEDRADIRALLAIIVRGQRLDLTRWPVAGGALAHAAELREYTYLVAGCVGEFWTRLCFRKLARFSDRPESEMIALGNQFGCGLQLVNILRDAGADLRAGRCYLPAEELHAAGISPDELINAPPSADPILQRWIEEARAGLRSGIAYSLAVENARVRIATALPAMIGLRTLDLLQAAGVQALRERIKVPRREVRGMIGSLVITMAARSRLRAQLRK